MIHIFQQGLDHTTPTFLMLHGLGGTERDLVPLAKKLNPDANVLSVRGQVSDNGQTQHFNQTNLRIQTEELYKFLDEAAEKYQFHKENLVALGFGNGADMLVNILFSYPDVLRGAILFHPNLSTLKLDMNPQLVDTQIFIGASHNNSYCPKEETIMLEEKFKEAQADVTLHFENSLHYVTGELFAASKAWYEATYLK